MSLCATKNIILIGASGRMGQAIIETVNHHKTYESEIRKDKYPNSPNDMHHDPMHYYWSIIFNISRDLNIIGDWTPGDVIIDFSNAVMTNALAHHMIGHEIPLLICTTGLTDETRGALERCSLTCPVMLAPNTSTGVLVLHKMLKLATQMLDSTFDVDIIETHHRNKVDTPSGTALSLKNTIQSTRSTDVGVHSLRSGDVVTEHVVSYRGNHETVTLTHSSHSRKVFAEGALRLAAWLIQQKPGLYGPESTF